LLARQSYPKMFCTNSPHDDNGEINNSNVQVMMTTKDDNIIEEDDNISMSTTTTTTTTSLHSSIRDSRCETGSCLSSDEYTKLMSPCLSIGNIIEVMEDPSTSRRSSSSSSSSSSSWSTYEYIDLRYTFISNLMFLVGASIQTYTSIIDLKVSRADALMDDDGCDDDYVNTFSDKMYYVLNSLGPFLYIMNACIDIRWQLDLASTPLSWLSIWSWCRCRFARRSQQEESPTSSDDNNDRDLTTEEEEQHQQYQYQEAGENVDSNNDDDEISLSTIQSAITSSFESTDETYWGLVTGFIFGIGATFELYSTFLDDYYEDADDWDDDTYLIKEEMKRPWYASNYKIGFIGMNLYLLSGIVELIAQRKSYRSGCNISMSCCRRDEQHPTNKPQSVELESTLLSSSSSSSLSPDKITKTLMFLGTFLFVCGTLLDCTIALLYDPEARHDLDLNKTVIINNVVLDTCSLISSLLWNVDAVLYIISDILLYSLHKEDSKARRWLCGGDIKKAQSSSSSNNSNDSNDSNTDPLLFEQQQNYSTL
jgi:hypothetical protein